MYNIGAGSTVYREAYYFFERLRLLRKEPKSHHRLLSEKSHPHGYSLTTPSSRRTIKMFRVS